MSKTFRDSIFYLFIVIFIVATTVLSLYASGYKFNLSWPLKFNRLLVKTGMLALDSSPKGASIYINGELEPDSSWRPWKKKYVVTPAKVKNLIPGEYEVRFEKDGYWPFQKKVSVYSGQTTFLEDITLFKSGNPDIKAITGENGNNENLLISPDGKYLYLSESAIIVNLANGEKKELTSSSTDMAVWQKGDKLFLRGMLYSPKKGDEDKNYRSLIGDSASDWKLDEESGDIYYQNGSTLGILSTGQKTAQVVINDYNYLDYLPVGDSILLIARKDSAISIKKYSVSEKNIILDIPLPNNGEYRFAGSTDDYVVISDDKNKAVYFLDKKSEQPSLRKIGRADSWSLPLNGSMFFIEGWEIHRYNIKQNEDGLLTRLSEPLKNILPEESDDYIVFTSEKKIGVFDLKTGFITIILEADNIGSAALDADNDLLYFWGMIKGQSGIYSIPIK